MPRTYNRWILTKSCDFPPNGPLQLGQILAEPFEPGYVLQPAGPLEIPSKLIHDPTFQEGVNIDSTSELAANFGLWARVIGVPAGGGFQVEVDRSTEMAWHFKKLESRTASPSLAYVRAAMKYGDVPETLKTYLFKRRVYMVTGVRAAHGAHMEKRDQDETLVQARIDGDLSSQEIPVAAGARAGAAMIDAETHKFDSASDFVFAYRLNEVHYRGKITHKPFKKGEISAAEGPDSGRRELSYEDFDVDQLETEDFDGDGYEESFEEHDVPDHLDLKCLIVI